MSNWRLFPPKKPPRIPIGERWGGLLSPATLISFGIVVAIVVVFVIGSTFARSDAPTTLEGVTAEVMTEVDVTTSVLGESSSPIDDVTDLIPCPDDGPGQQYTITRTFDYPSTTLPGETLQKLRDEYEPRDWIVKSSDLGSEAGWMQIQLVGLNLVPVTVTLQPNGPITEATITSASRCTDPDGE